MFKVENTSRLGWRYLTINDDGRSRRIEFKSENEMETFHRWVEHAYQCGVRDGEKSAKDRPYDANVGQHDEPSCFSEGIAGNCGDNCRAFVPDQNGNCGRAESEE